MVGNVDYLGGPQSRLSTRFQVASVWTLSTPYQAITRHIEIN